MIPFGECAFDERVSLYINDAIVLKVLEQSGTRDTFPSRHTPALDS